MSSALADALARVLHVDETTAEQFATRMTDTGLHLVSDARKSRRDSGSVRWTVVSAELDGLPVHVRGALDRCLYDKSGDYVSWRDDAIGDAFLRLLGRVLGVPGCEARP